MAVRSLLSVPCQSLAAALLCASASAQLTQAWVEKFADPSYPVSAGSAVAFLPQGDFVVVGYAASSTRDFLTIRYDPQGNQIWARTYDGPLHDGDEARAVSVDSAGNVIVAGLSRGTATNATEDALATCKYAPDGTLLWARRYERLGDNTTSLGPWGGLAIDSADNIYVAGSMLAKSPGATVDVVLVSYDALGASRWVATHPEGGLNLTRDLAVTPNGELRLVAGFGNSGCWTYAFGSNGSLLWERFDPGGSGEDVAVNAEGTTFALGGAVTGSEGRLRILAYDALGNLLWKTVLPSQDGFVESPGALCPGAAGDLYVTAYSSNSSFPPLQDILTARMGPTGDLLWRRTFGSPGAALESSHDLAVDGAGNAYIAGIAAGFTQVGSPSSCLTLKYSPTGEVLGQATFGEPTGPLGFPNAKAVAVELANDASFLIVTGDSISTCTTLRYDHVAPPSVYCTSKPSSIAGCTPSLGGTSGTASVSGSAPVCDVVCAPVPGGSKAGIAIASTGGPLNPPVLQTFGWLCIESGPGFFRLPADQPGGTNGHCDGYYEFDVRAWLSSHAGNPALTPGGTLDLQVWYRDPPNPGGANLSNALGLDLVP